MVNSSPDYAITKPGVRPLSRKRDKPLRTYGRQPNATPEPRSEPPAKRVRTAYAVPGDKNIKPLGITVTGDEAPTVAPVFKAKTQLAGEEDQENEPACKPEPNVPAKRSILNYFKPVTTHLTPIKPAKTNILPVAELVTKETVTPAPRPKRRLLRIRSNQSIDSDDAQAGHEHNSEKERDEACDSIKDEPRPGRKRRLGGGGSASSDSRRIRRKLVSSEVQTTLNISNQAAFSECKMCDTVWNPLYPDDVKYHTKRHAAHLRAKKKRDDDF